MHKDNIHTIRVTKKIPLDHTVGHLELCRSQELVEVERQDLEHQALVVVTHELFQHARCDREKSPTHGMECRGGEGWGGVEKNKGLGEGWSGEGLRKMKD